MSTKRKLVEGKEVQSYTSIIENWIQESKTFEEDINFKELARLSNKEIKKRMSCKKTNDGKYIIQSHSIHKDIWFYYNNPHLYYSDVFRFIKNIRYAIHKNMCSRSLYVTYSYPNDPKIYEMSLIHFTFNMIMWLPLFILGIPITKELTFMPKEFNNKSYTNFINNKIIEPYKHLVTHNEMSKILAKMYDLFIIISERYSLDLGLSFSLNDLISRWDNKEIYDINHTKIGKNMQISEAENYLNQRLKRYIEIMTEEEGDNVLKPLLRSGQGVNNKQLREFAVSIGYKPDTNGYTIPYDPKTNFISDGLRDAESFSVDASGGRKAAILALEIDNSGLIVCPVA